MTDHLFGVLTDWARVWFGYIGGGALLLYGGACLYRSEWAYERLVSLDEWCRNLLRREPATVSDRELFPPAPRQVASFASPAAKGFRKQPRVVAIESWRPSGDAA